MAKEVDGYITRKKDMNFQSVEALQSVVNVVNEAAAALNDKKERFEKVQFRKYLQVRLVLVLVV